MTSRTATSQSVSALSGFATNWVQRFREGSAWIVITTVAVILVIWEFFPQSGLVNRILFPTFGDTVSAFIQLVGGGYW